MINPTLIVLPSLTTTFGPCWPIQKYRYDYRALTCIIFWANLGLTRSLGVQSSNKKRAQDVLYCLKLAWGEHMSSLCRSLLSLRDNIYAWVEPIKWRLLRYDSYRFACSGVWGNTLLHCGPFCWNDCQTKLGHTGAPDSFYSKCGVHEEKPSDTDWGKRRSCQIVQQTALTWTLVEENHIQWRGQNPSGSFWLVCRIIDVEKSSGCHVFATSVCKQSDLTHLYWPQAHTE